MRRLLAGLAVLVACAAATPAVADDPTPTPSSDPEAPAVVLVTKLAPRAPMDPDEFFQVRGTITNRGSQPLTAVHVRLRRGEVLQRRSELDLADREQPATGTRIGVPVGAASDELAPGTSTAFDIRIRVSLLRLGRNSDAIGVYPLRVEVRARTGDQGNSTVGSVLTYVPWFPDGPPTGRTRIAWVWPLVDQPRRGPREVVLDQALEKEVARNGRLDTLLRAAGEGQKGRCDDRAQGPVDAAPRPAAAPCRGESVPVTYAVDPDLLVDAQAMAARPYQLRVSAKRTRDVDATAVFGSWLSGLREAVAPSNVLALPYADPDVVALSNPETGLADEVARLRVLGESETSAILGKTPLRSVVWPPSGRLTPAALETLSSGGATAAVLDPVAIAGRDDDTGRTPSAHVGQLGQATGAAINGLVVDSGLSELVNRSYDDYPGARLAEQRWVAETAMIAAEAPSVSRTLVVAPARRAEVVGAVASAVLYDTGRLPWLCPVSLADVVVGQEACAGEVAAPAPEQEPATLEQPLRDDPLLSPRFLGKVAQARNDSTQLTDRVLEPGEEARRTTARLLRARARTESSAWRDDPRAGGRMLDLLDDDLVDLRGKIHLQIGTGTVTLTSRTGAISVNVVNELGQQVRVGVRLGTANSARLSLKEVPVELIPPGSSTQISLKVTSATSGKFEVKAQLLDRANRPFGAERTLVVRSTEYGRVALAVTGVAAGVLLLAAGVRITRRALRRP